MRITSIAARFSGVVAYSDNTHGQFHTQSDVLIWSQDQADSIENLKQLSWFEPQSHYYPYWVAIEYGLSALGFMTFDWDTPLPTLQKEVSSISLRFDLIVTFDDNTVAYAAVSGSGHIDAVTNAPIDSVIITDPRIAEASNIADIRTQLSEMFKEVMDEVWITA